MTMRGRCGDLGAYPDTDTEDTVLRDFTESQPSEYGYSYNRTLGDLLVDLLTDSPFGPTEQGNGEPENWESLEHAFMRSTTVQLKALNYCMTSEARGAQHETDHAPDLTSEELSMMLSGITKRLQAGAELTSRLRRARWGHPNFGGGEGWEERQDTLEKSERIPAVEPAKAVGK